MAAELKDCQGERFRESLVVVAGIPHTHPGHAQRLAILSREKGQYMAYKPGTNGHAINYRIGIGSGPFVGAEIGRIKCHYDILIEAIINASHICVRSLSGRIQNSDETCPLLKGDFTWDLRGLIEVKGEGEMKNRFLAGRKEVGHSEPAKSVNN